MRKLLPAIAVTTLLAGRMFAQQPAVSVYSGIADPLNCKSPGRNIFLRNDTGTLKICNAGVWISLGTGSGTVTSVGLAGTANQITVTGTSPITTSGSWTLSFPVGGVTLPATTTGTFSGNLTGNVTGNTSGTSGSTTGNAATASAADHTPTACGANTFAQSQSTVWSFTCASLVLAGAQFANQGTTTTLLHGNGAGNPAFGPVLSADLNITPTTCTNQFISALSSAAAGTCTALTLAAFPAIATNTVLVNATSGTAVPTAQAVSTCSGASNALNWTTNTGFGCNGSITANTATTATTATNATNTAITDDTSTNATVFPTWVATASGNQAQKTSSTTLMFNPSTGNVGFGVAPSAVVGVRLLAELDGNQPTKLVTKNVDAVSAGAASIITAQAAVAAAQLSAFGTSYAGTLFGLNLAGQSSVNNGGVGTTGFTVGTTNGVKVILGTNATRALTIDATSQAVSLRGTQTNDNATAGDVGELLSATIASGSAVSLTTNTVTDVTSVALTAGDWDCDGQVDYKFGATTSITSLIQGINTTSATLGGQDTFSAVVEAANVPGNAVDFAAPAPTVRLSLSGSATAFLVTRAIFTLSTTGAYGTIRCRRVR